MGQRPWTTQSPSSSLSSASLHFPTPFSPMMSLHLTLSSAFPPSLPLPIFPFLSSPTSTPVPHFSTGTDYKWQWKLSDGPHSSTTMEGSAEPTLILKNVRKQGLYVHTRLQLRTAHTCRSTEFESDKWGVGCSVQSCPFWLMHLSLIQ